MRDAAHEVHDREADRRRAQVEAPVAALETRAERDTLLDRRRARRMRRAAGRGARIRTCWPRSRPRDRAAARDARRRHAREPAPAVGPAFRHANGSSCALTCDLPRVPERASQSSAEVVPAGSWSSHRPGAGSASSRRGSGGQRALLVGDRCVEASLAAASRAAAESARGSSGDARSTASTSGRAARSRPVRSACR